MISNRSQFHAQAVSFVVNQKIFRVILQYVHILRNLFESWKVTELNDIFLPMRFQLQKQLQFNVAHCNLIMADILFRFLARLYA